MRNELKRALVAAGLLAGCAGLHAADKPAESTAERLTRIESETAVLKAQARKADVQAQIAAKQAETAARHAEARRQAPPRESAVLRGIDGMGDALYASIDVPGHGVVDARAGDRLPDGSRVVSVRPTEVTLQQGKQRMKLTPRMNASTLTAQAGAALPELEPPLPDLPAPRGVRR